MPGPQLPSARAFLTDLFSSLPAAAAGHDNRNDSKTTVSSSSSILNPLKDLQPGAQQHRNIFLTLHVLFPNELLPALDLLDRRLVTRVVINPPNPPPPSPPSSSGGGPSEREREAGPTAPARGAAETAEQPEQCDERAEAAQPEKTSPAASRHAAPGGRPFQAAHHHDLDGGGNNLHSSRSSNSQARNAATDKNGTATTNPTGSIAVQVVDVERSAAAVPVDQAQPVVDNSNNAAYAATPTAMGPAASMSGHPYGDQLLLATRIEDHDATAATAPSAAAAAAARCQTTGQQKMRANGQSNSGAAMITSSRPGDGDAGSPREYSVTGNEEDDGEQTTQFQVPVASGGLAGAPPCSTTERRRAVASASSDNYDDCDERGQRRAGTSAKHVQSQSIDDHNRRRQQREVNQVSTALQEAQPCHPDEAPYPPRSPSPRPQDAQAQEHNLLEQGHHDAPEAPEHQDSSTLSALHHVVFYVRSASSSTATSHNHSHSHKSQQSPPPVYEVRLGAWHCTCPAFAFAAFPASASGSVFSVGSGAEFSSSPSHPRSPRSSSSSWSFGGLLRERRREAEIDAIPPVCKHLLACLLVERAPGLFGVDVDAAAAAATDGHVDAGAGLVTQRRVGVLEAAGWAAGWGGL